MSGFYKAQAETDHSVTPQIWGDDNYLEAQTIAQDATRSIALADMTVMAQIASSGQWTPLRDVDPAATAGYMTCGAFGSTVKAMKAITDGEFKVQIDGETAITVGSLNFSKIAGIGDTAGHMVTGALGTDLAGMQAVTTGAFSITVDGTAIAISGLDFSAITALDEIADVINYQAAGRFTAVYDSKTTKTMFISPSKGTISSVSALSAPGAGTDISGSGFLNGLTGTAVITAGTGTDGTGQTIEDVINANATFAATGAKCEWTGTAFRFISPTLGVNSAVSVLTAGAAGTDISGASYLNGLTGTGTATAGTGLDGSHLPRGIYRGGSIAAATIVEGTTTGEIHIGGNAFVNEDDLVLENSLDLDDAIPDTKETIRAALHKCGIYPRTTAAADANV